MTKTLQTYFFIIFTNLCAMNNYSNSEFRATWVITWNHIDRYAPAHINQANVQNIMENHAQANMNAVIFQARQGGTAYYESSYEPWGSYAGYSHPGYDPLEYAIAEAHERGLELHAWFNVFQTSSTQTGSPAAEHPEWVCRDQDGFTMDSYRSISPGLPEVRAYTVNVAMEIVNNYDIDGLHLDYVRWNEHTNSLNRTSVDHLDELQRMDGIISDEELAALSTRSGRYLYDYMHPYSAGVPEGFDSWEDWWRWSVTEFVHTLYDSIQAVKPHVRLSVAALGKYNWSGWQGYGTVYQDGALWFNEGYIDQLMPMHYHWYTADGFYGMLEGDCPECWGQFIQPGISAGRLFTSGPGSYILEENNVWNNHGPIVETCRSIPWIDGFQFFSYGSWRDRNYWSSAGNSFFNWKSKIRPIPGNSQAPAISPSLILTPIDSLTHDLTVVPSDPNQNAWFILYRSTGEELDPDQAEIVDIHFTKEPFTIRSVFQTTQDSIMLYGVTQADRFWNETALSSIVVASTVPIPDKPNLYRNYPNPFNDTTTIPYSVSYPAQIKIDVSTLLGQHMVTLVDHAEIPGYHHIQWNGRNGDGLESSSGIYLVQMKMGNNVINSRKLCLIK